MTVDISQVTLEVIEAVKQQKTVSFKYGGHDNIRIINSRRYFRINWISFILFS